MHAPKLSKWRVSIDPCIASSPKEIPGNIWKVSMQIKQSGRCGGLAWVTLCSVLLCTSVYVCLARDRGALGSGSEDPELCLSVVIAMGSNFNSIYDYPIGIASICHHNYNLYEEYTMHNTRINTSHRMVVTTLTPRHN